MPTLDEVIMEPSGHVTLIGDTAGFTSSIKCSHAIGK